MSGPILVVALLILLPICQAFTSIDYQSLSEKNSSYDNQRSKKLAHWNYRQNGADWGTFVPNCNGPRQSPIRLHTDDSLDVQLPYIIYGHYGDMLKQPLTLKNNGHTMYMAIPNTIFGKKPYIAGGLLNDVYEIDSLHFHWGSANSEGTEHSIHNRRYDLELHMIHRNIAYRSNQVANQHPDGYAVVGVLFGADKFPRKTVLGSILSKASETVNPGSETKIKSFALDQILGNLTTNFFYTYYGSLTTPDCNQAVTWIVFGNVLPISKKDLSHLWNTKDDEGKFLTNTYRQLQPTKHIQVFHTLYPKRTWV